MHHHKQQRTANLNLWRSLLYLTTAAIALILNQTTPLGLIASIALGFLIAAALLWTANHAIHGRDERGPHPQ